LLFPLLSRVDFACPLEQRCIFATLCHASTRAARQMGLRRLPRLVTPQGMYIMAKTCRKVRAGVGVGQWTKSWNGSSLIFWIDRATAEQAVGIIFDFLVREGPAKRSPAGRSSSESLR
jgi:hypothetical protein